ncbi:hypothetical protein ACNI3Q_06700 [Sphingomonas sp. FW199]|uniref:hypothetical protein n=1 Tax=Sphingomonas sp. FW199 TaxID=3400217 RepID=UPI003CF35C42
MPAQLAETELAALRGGQTIVVNNQTLAATTSGNIMGDNVAGNISLADNALSNFNGIGNFVINTGAQNNLQAGMTLTVTVQP